MTQDEAEAIILEVVRREYISTEKNGESVLLDGRFTPRELEAILIVLKSLEGTGRSWIV